jgi:integrase
LRKLLEKRTKFISTDRLFLTPNPSCQNQQSKGWFKNTPVGRNQISSWMAESAKKIGIDTKKNKITNHSVRATAVSNLAKQGVGEQQLIKITGHSSAHSIRPYLQMDMEHHQTIINSMRQKIKPFGSSSCNDTSSLSDNSSKNMITYNNCVFNFNSNSSN